MSLYELESMWRNMQPKTNEPTDEEFEEGMALIESAVAGMADVKWQ